MSDVYEMVRQFRTTLGSAARHYIRLYELCEEVNKYDRAFGGDAYLMLDEIGRVYFETHSGLNSESEEEVEVEPELPLR